MKKNKGITLVALIITIIVMLILVAVSVRLIINSNILGTAKSAGENYEAKQAEESNLTVNETIDKYIGQKETEEEIPKAPKLSITSGTLGNEGWYRSDVIVAITPQTSSQSGTEKTTYIISGAQIKDETEGTSVRIRAEGESTITAYTYNSEGKKSEPATITIKKDSIVPTFELEVNTAENTWAVSDLSDGDGSGITDNTIININWHLDNAGEGYDCDGSYTGSERSGTIYYEVGPLDPSSVTISATIEDIAGNVSKITKTGNAFCFVAGTKVLTESGLKNIEEIKLGEMVYAINMDTNEKKLARVSALINGYSTEIYEITIGNVVIEASPEHPFYVTDRGWVNACKLKEGENLIALKTGEEMAISSIKYVQYEEPVPVYNLVIESEHNYLITHYNFLVHNPPSAAYCGIL